MTFKKITKFTVRRAKSYFHSFIHSSMHSKMLLKPLDQSNMWPEKITIHKHKATLRFNEGNRT